MTLQASIRSSIEAFACPTAAAVPSGSYVAYERSSEYGSELQKVQAQRAKESAEAWKSVPMQDVLHDIPQHVSADGLQRVQALISRFPSARHAPPAEASLRARK